VNSGTRWTIATLCVNFGRHEPATLRHDEQLHQRGARSAIERNAE
jgi:hypothetical protein